MSSTLLAGAPKARHIEYKENGRPATQPVYTRVTGPNLHHPTRQSKGVSLLKNAPTTFIVS